MKFALVMALIALPIAAHSEELHGSAHRQKVDTQEYCAGVRRELSSYAGKLSQQIMRNSTDFNDDGYIDPGVANRTRQLMQFKLEEMATPWRRMMYQNPDRKVCHAMANDMARQLRDMATPVINSYD